MQNKPNFRKSQVNVKSFDRVAYENIANWTLGENKPNTNPIKPNTKPIKANTKPIKANIMPKQTQSNPISKAKKSPSPVMDFKVGAKGREFATVIRSIEKDPWQKNPTILTLKLNLPPEAVSSVKFYAQDGAKLDISQYGCESIGSVTTLKFSVKAALPPNGRIVLNVFEGLKKNVVPFKITNISLTGQPMW